MALYSEEKQKVLEVENNYCSLAFGVTFMKMG